MKSKIFSRKDKLFLVLFSISFFSISYSTYKVVGILKEEETISLVQVLKSTVSNLRS